MVCRNLIGIKTFLYFYNSCMSTNKLSHLKEWEKIYIPMERIVHLRDDTDWLCFHDVNWCTYWVTDEDTFYTLDELKQLANDGVPKQGDEIDVRHNDWDYISWQKFVCLYEWRVIIERAWWLFRYDEWRYPPKKTELTLAEVEKKLGLEKGSLIIKD